MRQQQRQQQRQQLQMQQRQQQLQMQQQLAAAQAPASPSRGRGRGRAGRARGAESPSGSPRGNSMASQMAQTLSAGGANLALGPAAMPMPMVGAAAAPQNSGRYGATPSASASGGGGIGNPRAAGKEDASALDGDALERNGLSGSYRGSVSGVGALLWPKLVAQRQPLPASGGAAGGAGREAQLAPNFRQLPAPALGGASDATLGGAELPSCGALFEAARGSGAAGSAEDERFRFAVEPLGRPRPAPAHEQRAVSAREDAGIVTEEMMADLLRPAAGAALGDNAFEGIQRSALEVLTEVGSAYMTRMCSSMRRSLDAQPGQREGEQGLDMAELLAEVLEYAEVQPQTLTEFMKTTGRK